MLLSLERKISVVDDIVDGKRIECNERSHGLKIDFKLGALLRKLLSR